MPGLKPDTATVSSDRLNAGNMFKISQIKEYDLLHDLYHGTGCFRDGSALVEYHREKRYETRKELSFLRNYLKPISNAKIDPVFRRKVLRDVKTVAGAVIADPLFAHFIRNCDNSGTPLHNFMKAASREAGLQGMDFIVEDTFPKESMSPRRQENIDNRKFPYVYYVPKSLVRNYELDQFGGIRWIIFWESEKKENGKTATFYRYWDAKQNILCTKPDNIALDISPSNMAPLIVVEHPVGEIPVYPMYAVKRESLKKLDVTSPLYDIARLNWCIYNVDSELREVIRNQGFGFLAIQADQDSSLAIGTGTALPVSMEAKWPPQYVSPDPALIAGIREYMGDIRESIFQIAEQNGVTAVKEAKSGIAKEWDFQAHSEVLADTAEWVARAEIWIARIFQKYTNENFQYSPVYPSTFEPRASVTVIENLEKVVDGNFPPAVKAMAKKKMVGVIFQDESEESLQESYDAIDKEFEDEDNAGEGTEDEPGAE